MGFNKLMTYSTQAGAYLINHFYCENIKESIKQNFPDVYAKIII